MSVDEGNQIKVTVRELNIALMHTPLSETRLREELQKAINTLIEEKQTEMSLPDIPWSRAIKGMAEAYTEIKRAQRR